MTDINVQARVDLWCRSSQWCPWFSPWRLTCCILAPIGFREWRLKIAYGPHHPRHRCSLSSCQRIYLWRSWLNAWSSYWCSNCWVSDRAPYKNVRMPSCAGRYAMDLYRRASRRFSDRTLDLQRGVVYRCTAKRRSQLFLSQFGAHRANGSL
jgi:hypothetical protein